MLLGVDGMNLPDISLPFFVYGLFKPNELSYFRIKKFVKATEKVGIPGILKERDGVPLFEQCKGCEEIKGYIIYFDPFIAEEAYDEIMAFEPKKLYKWEVIEIKSQMVNVLVGKRMGRGIVSLDHVYEWNGKDDPYFSDALEEVESVLRSHEEFDWDYKVLFRLQMAYLLLWTAIERYATLRYSLGEGVNQKISKISEEPIFAESLKHHVQKPREIFRASDPKTSYKLDPNNPKGALDYYYQVRSNSVHRGKALFNDFCIIKNSTKELLAIFKDVLEDSWNV